MRKLVALLAVLPGCHWYVDQWHTSRGWKPPPVGVVVTQEKPGDEYGCTMLKKAYIYTQDRAIAERDLAKRCGNMEATHAVVRRVDDDRFGALCYLCTRKRPKILDEKPAEEKPTEETTEPSASSRTPIGQP